MSGARRSSAFSFACSALDGLEAQLALEEAELNSVRAKLERAWVRLLETMESCRQGDEASRVQREEARRFAKEVRVATVEHGVPLMMPKWSQHLWFY